MQAHKLYFEHQCQVGVNIYLLLDIRRCLKQGFKPINTLNMIYELDEDHMNCVFDRILRHCKEVTMVLNYMTNNDSIHVQII